MEIDEQDKEEKQEEAAAQEEQVSCTRMFAIALSGLLQLVPFISVVLGPLFRRAGAS
jgi:hypothetical protein